MKPSEQAAVEQLERDYANILARPEGRRVIWSIMMACGIHSSSYRGNADTNYLEGKRAVGLQILEECILPNGSHLFGQMLQEHEDWLESLKVLDQHEADDD